jgi:hypothetical protein
MTSPFHCSPPLPLGANQKGSVLCIRGVRERVRLHLLEAEFCSRTLNKVKVDMIGILTLLRGRLGFAALFITAEWWTEAKYFPRASKALWAHQNCW